MRTQFGALFLGRPALGAVTALATAVACSDSGDAPAVAHPPGTEQGPCLDGDVCNGELVCLSHTCVALVGTGGAGGANGTSGRTGSGGTAGTGGNSTGGANGGTSGASGGNAGGATNGGTSGADGGNAGGTTSGGTAGIAGGGAAGLDASAGGNAGTAGSSGGTAGSSKGGAGGSGGTSAGGAGGSGGLSGGRGGTGGSVCTDGGCMCPPTALSLVPSPLDVYVLFDQSLSMSENVAGGTKWDLMTSALSAFVQAPSSDGIHIGLGYFPLVVPGAPTSCVNDVDCGQYGPCIGGGSGLGICQKADTCLWNNYLPEIPFSLLPGASQSVVDSLAAHSPSGLTPTYAALRATYEYVRGWAQGHAGDQTVVVLATDGNPTTCDASTNNVNTIATTLVAPALSGDPSVQTFVIGVGSSLTSMNQIAAAGGTQQAFLVDTTVADAGSQFLDAMTKITKSPTLACEYQIPSAPGGGTLDLANARLQIKMSSGPAASVNAVSNRAACSVSTGGWYVVGRQQNPEKIVLCNSTCTPLRGTPGAAPELVAGCTAP